MCAHLFGKLFGDRGYISKEKADMLYEKFGVELITTRKKNISPGTNWNHLLNQAATRQKLTNPVFCPIIPVTHQLR